MESLSNLLVKHNDALMRFDEGYLITKELEARRNARAQKSSLRRMLVL